MQRILWPCQRAGWHVKCRNPPVIPSYSKLGKRKFVLSFFFCIQGEFRSENVFSYKWSRGFSKDNLERRHKVPLSCNLQENEEWGNATSRGARLTSFYFSDIVRTIWRFRQMQHGCCHIYRFNQSIRTILFRIAALYRKHLSCIGTLYPLSSKHTSQRNVIHSIAVYLQWTQLARHIHERNLQAFKEIYKCLRRWTPSHSLFATPTEIKTLSTEDG